jgi:UDP-N-acetylmuramoylalanine--D-glutamate ligase
VDSFLTGKRVAVVGMARSGIGAAKLVHRLGGRALISDVKSDQDLGLAVTDLTRAGVEVETGGHKRIGQEEFDLVILSPGVIPPQELTQVWERKRTPVWSELELASRVCAAPWIGVTGSNGKTTTVHLLHHILQTAGRDVEMVGNVGDAWSNHLPAARDRVFVVEVSSFQLEHSPTVKPNVAVLLNLYENHLDRHGTMDVYAYLKARLFRNQTPDDTAIINGDDEWAMKLAPSFRGKLVGFGTNPDLEFWTDGLSLFQRREGKAQLILDRKKFPLVGRHNVLNALAAAAAAFSFGTDTRTIGEALQTAKPVEHRIEFVTDRRGVRYVNDSKSTNLVATQTALDAFENNVILLFGGRFKKESFTPLGKRFFNPIKAMVVFGEAVSKVRAELSGDLPIQYRESLRDAVETATAMARPGDTILLSPGCASFDQFKDFEERGRLFKSLVSMVS